MITENSVSVLVGKIFIVFLGLSTCDCGVFVCICVGVCECEYCYWHCQMTAH